MTRIVSMILAGGKGKRMDLLCYNRPKPVLPFAGAFKVIDFALSNCVHSNVASISVLVDHQKEFLAEYLKTWERNNARSTAFQVLEPGCGSYRGTADAIYQNINYVKTQDPDALLVLAGDHVYRMDYGKMAAFHESKGADITIGAVTVPLDQARRFGTIMARENGQIIGFEEKPLNPLSNLVSMGIYIFKWKVLQDYLEQDSRLPNSSHDFGYSIIPEIIKNGRAFAYKFDGYWQDIGTVDAYYNANMELISVMPMLGMNDRWPILNSDFSLLPPKVQNSDNIKYSVISPGCVVKGSVENSILGPGVKVAEQCRIKNSIVLSNSTIGRCTIVDRCIIDEDVNIKEFCYIGFGAARNSNSMGITVLGKGAVVPQGTAIGHSSKVLPDVQPVDFNARTLPARSVVLQHSSI
jgi:glucose-1-phosphate adenylyltransferase